jgi:hypothetical protein
MGVSAVGQGNRLSTLRYGLATLAVFLGMFTFFYGPPMLPSLTDGARRTCNQLTGSSFRNFVVEWRTTTLRSIDPPHWVCYDLRAPGHPGTSLGWWAGS